MKRGVHVGPPPIAGDGEDLSREHPCARVQDLLVELGRRVGPQACSRRVHQLALEHEFPQERAGGGVVETREVDRGLAGRSGTWVRVEDVGFRF